MDYKNTIFYYWICKQNKTIIGFLPSRESSLKEENVTTLNQKSSTHVRNHNQQSIATQKDYNATLEV